MSETNVNEEVLAESPEALREQALRRVKKRRDLHAHLFAYLVLNAVVWGVWTLIALTTSHNWYPWPLWITLGWGIGLIFNAWDVYIRRPITETEIRREMEHLAHGV